MSVASPSHSLNFTVCSYRVPAMGQCQEDEKDLVDRRAHIYIVRADVGHKTRFIIQKLKELSYTVFPDLPVAATFVAMDPSRFKFMGYLQNSTSYTSVQLHEPVSDTMLHVSSIIPDLIGWGETPAHFHNELDPYSESLHLVAAPLDISQEFSGVTEKILKPLDMGNLVVKAPAEFFQHRVDRLFNPGFTAARVATIHHEEILPATFVIVHGKEAQLPQLIKRINHWLAHTKNPLIACGRTALAQGCAAANTLLSKRGFKEIAFVVTGVFLLNVPRILNLLGFSLLHPLITVPARAWMVYSALTAEKSAKKTALIIASISVIALSLNAPVLVNFVGGVVGSVVITLGCLTILTLPTFERKQLVISAVGLAVSVALIEMVNYFAFGEFKQFINSFELPNL